MESTANLMIFCGIRRKFHKFPWKTTKCHGKSRDECLVLVTPRKTGKNTNMTERLLTYIKHQHKQTKIIRDIFSTLCLLVMTFPIKQLSTSVIKIVTFKGGHLMWKSDFSIFTSEGFVVSTFRQTLRLTTLKIYY